MIFAKLVPTSKKKERKDMSALYKKYLKKITSASLYASRTALGLTQERMAERLHISVRAYVELEAGRSLCSTCTLIRYLLTADPAVGIRLMEGLCDAVERWDRREEV